MMAMDLKDTYNKIAEDWHKDHTQDDWWVDGTLKFISLVGVGKEVLDVGCGAGTKSKFLKENGLSVTGIDFSEKMIEIAKRENHEVPMFANVKVWFMIFLTLKSTLAEKPAFTRSKSICIIQFSLKTNNFR